MATINFSKVAQKTDPTFIGIGSSTYGANPLSSSAQAAIEERLDARYVRIPVGIRNGRVTTSAGGGNTSLDVPALVKWYRDRGYRVIAVLGGRSNDTDIQSGDATQMIRALGMDGIDYSAPNEPTNQGKNINDEINYARMIVQEGKAISSGFKVWGPVWSYYDRSAVSTFAKAIGGDLGGADYHHYAMGSGSISTDQSMRDTVFWGQEVRDVMSDLAGAGLPQQVNVDEMNYSWRFNDGTNGGNNTRFFTSINSVWCASVLGHVARAGGRGMIYASQNGPLGVMVEGGNNDQGRPASTPMPAYWGIAAWTGSKIWPHYKDAFYDVTDLNDQYVECWAVNNEAGGYNLVVLNKSEGGGDKTLPVSLTNIARGAHDIYQSRQSNPYDAPIKIATDKAYDTSLSLTLPPMTVTVVVLKPSGTAPVPPPVDSKNVWKINVGSGAVTGWESAANLVTGGTSASNKGTTTPPAGVPEQVFDSERYGTETFKIPVPGTDKVLLRLLFAERYTGAQTVGARQFNIRINGVIAATNYDVWRSQGAKAGAHAAFQIDVAPVNGALTVDLIKGAAGEPFINAITVDPISVPVPPPTDTLVVPTGATVAQVATAHNELVSVLRANGTI